MSSHGPTALAERTAPGWRSGGTHAARGDKTTAHGRPPCARRALDLCAFGDTASCPPATVPAPCAVPGHAVPRPLGDGRLFARPAASSRRPWAPDPTCSYRMAFTKYRRRTAASVEKMAYPVSPSFVRHESCQAWNAVQRTEVLRYRKIAQPSHFLWPWGPGRKGTLTYLLSLQDASSHPGPYSHGAASPHGPGPAVPARPGPSLDYQILAVPKSNRVNGLRTPK